MSASNDPIEITVDKRGTVIILIDRHTLSAAEVLDMAARAMLAAGYQKAHILQAALAYAGRYEGAKAQSPVAAIAPPPVASEPSKVATAEPTVPLVQPVLPPPLPVTPPPVSKEAAPAEPSTPRELPVAPSLNKEPESTGAKEIVATTPETAPRETPPVADLATQKTEVPAAITPAPVPEPPKAPSLPVVEEKPIPAPVVVAAAPPPAPVTPPAEATETPAPLKPAAAPVAASPELPPAAPSVSAVEVKSTQVAAAAAAPPPFEVPPLAKAPAFPAGIQAAAPVSVIGNKADGATEHSAPAGPSSKSKMDEILAADRKRIQDLIAAAAGKRPTSEPVPAAPAEQQAPVVQPTLPPAAIPLKMAVTPVSVVVPKPQEPAQATEMVAAQTEEWQGQKFDPNTSTSMLIPPLPGTSETDTPESAAAGDVPLSPPPLPKKPVSVVTPAMMARPATDDITPKPTSKIPPPPGGPLSLLSRITGFVKLNTIAIPHYQPEPVESTINTPKPVTPSVLSPQPPPTAPAKK